MYALSSCIAVRTVRDYVNEQEFGKSHFTPHLLTLRISRYSTMVSHENNISRLTLSERWRDVLNKNVTLIIKRFVYIIGLCRLQFVVSILSGRTAANGKYVPLLHW